MPKRSRENSRTPSGDGKVAAWNCKTCKEMIKPPLDILTFYGYAGTKDRLRLINWAGLLYFPAGPSFSRSGPYQHDPGHVLPHPGADGDRHQRPAYLSRALLQPGEARGRGPHHTRRPLPGRWDELRVSRRCPHWQPHGRLAHCGAVAGPPWAGAGACAGAITFPRSGCWATTRSRERPRGVPGGTWI
ncbi:hypothetical protein MHLNE_03720 [Moorella humiferrea]